MNRYSIFFVALAVPLECGALANDASAQYWGRSRGRDGYEEPERDIFPGNCFTFCRIIYQIHWDQDGGYGNPGRGRGRRGRSGWGGGWSTDWPDSDLNFPQRLSELTTIKVNRTEDGQIKHTSVSLMDDDLYNYPFAYMLEVGSLCFSDEEAERLREYLLRGGFLLVDDFWGSAAWQNWEYEFAKVFSPDEYPMIDMPLDHEIFHIVFPVDEVPQIPGIGFWYGSGGETSEHGEDSRIPACKGVFDKKGRLMVIIMHNTDLGDGWEEEAQNPTYFREFSAKKAYPLGINIVVYAMTH